MGHERDGRDRRKQHTTTCKSCKRIPDIKKSYKIVWTLIVGFVGIVVFVNTFYNEAITSNIRSKETEKKVQKLELVITKIETGIDSMSNDINIIKRHILSDSTK